VAFLARGHANDRARGVGVHMQIPETTIDVEMDSIESEDVEMGVELSAHAYGVLSKGLYSDPFRAIVRELCCNARDAQVDNGNAEKPFEVCLPNPMAPVFSVRDYGKGIAPENIKTLYTYFKSTKQASNLQTGFFGLGSKSPFAYTKKFTCISRHEGVKYHFSVHLNANGKPGTLLLAQNPTDEASGLEVSFSVEPQDFANFHNAARRALTPFAIKPTIHGVHGKFFQEEPKPFLEGQGWKLYSNQYDRTTGRYGSTAVSSLTARMGYVDYPVDAQGKSGISKNASQLCGALLLIEFPTGAFEITPAREAIQWTEYSINNINERLESIYEELVAHVTEKVSKASSLWKANIAFQKLIENGPLGQLGIRPTWNGRSVTGSMHIPHEFDLRAIRATMPRRDTEGKNAASVTELSQPVRPHETHFYYTDFTGSMARIVNYVRDKFARNQECYVIVPIREVEETDPRHAEWMVRHPSSLNNPFNPKILKRKPTFDKGKLPEFLKAFGIEESDVTMCSTVPQRPRAASSRQARLVGSKARAFSFKTEAWGSAADRYWDEAEVDLAAVKEGVYVQLDSWHLVNTVLGKRPREFKSWLEDFTGAGLTLPQLIGVKTADIKKFEKASNWITLDQYVLRTLKEKWADPEFQLCYKTWLLHDHDTYFEHLAAFQDKKGLSAGFKKLVEQIHKVVTTGPTTRHFHTCLPGSADFYGETQTVDGVTNALVTQALKSYPLLPALLADRPSHWTVPYKAVIEYCKLIDNQER